MAGQGSAVKPAPTVPAEGSEVGRKSAAPSAVVEAAPTCYLEAADAEGLVWEATLIRAGAARSSGFYYPDAVLREAAPLFDGARVFAKADTEHLAGAGKDVNKLAGWIDQPRFIEGSGPDTGRLMGRLNLSAAHPLRPIIADAWKRGKRDLVALSIDALGRSKAVIRGGVAMREAQSIARVNSVDLIVEPGAGGGLVRMVEAAAEKEDDDMSLKQRMLEAIRAKDAAKAAAIDLATITDEALETAYREALSPDPSPASGRGEPSGVTPEQLAETVRMVEARANARATLAAAKLPPAAKDRLQAVFAANTRFAEADVTAAIEAERAYLAHFTESGRVSLGFDGVEDRSVKIGSMMDAFFDTAHKDHRAVQSFRECYVEITGDKRVTGRLENVDRTRMAESLGAFREALDSTSFASVLGSSLTRRLVAEYRAAVEYDLWRNLATVVPINDFRTQERTRFGGYGDLPTVIEGSPYGPLTSPTDEKATYAPAKRGGTEEITLEMIRNDDVGALRRVPVKLSRAAKRTLAKFVLDFIRTNPAIYDAVALFHASHANLGSAALDAASFAAGRLAMLKQTELSSTDRLGVGPANIWVPVDLQETAWNLFQRNTNLDKTFVQSLVPAIVPVWYWTDANDWVLSANPLDVPTIEVGFLDGQEEPELFVQDVPTLGSMFSNDKLTYKVRHIYGGNVLDYRGLYKAVVA
jgi:hypothetical protein